MAYEPEQRYSKDLSARAEVNAPFGEHASTDRGQFWAVKDHMRSRWARGGAGFGLTSAAIYVLLDGDIPQIFNTHTASTLAFFAAWMIGGAVVGIAAAAVRRRFTGEI